MVSFVKAMTSFLIPKSALLRLYRVIGQYNDYKLKGNLLDWCTWFDLGGPTMPVSQ